MNLLSLSLLEAIVRTGSYSGAAKEKNFSVAKVSFHINNLQDELNLILFEKVVRQMRLTKVDFFEINVEKISNFR